MALAPSRAAVAALLLTGGASRRMGFDKAQVRVGGVPNAERLASLLEEVAAGPVVEVGPGRTGLPSAQETPAGQGPLVAVAAGWAHLRHGSAWQGPVLVLACDLVLVTADALMRLARWPGQASVVPYWQGRAQPLCARWAAGDLDLACRLVQEGQRSMKALLEAAGVEAPPAGEGPFAASGHILTDVDTPEELRLMSLEPPAGPY